MDDKKLQKILAGAVFALSFTIYYLTMASTVSFWDCGELLAASNILGNPHPPGNPLFTLIALGCVIRGDTVHYDQVVQLVTKGVGEIADGKIPVAFGVLTTENLQQALERAGSKVGNKGWDTALAAIETASLWENL